MYVHIYIYIYTHIYTLMQFFLARSWGRCLATRSAPSSMRRRCYHCNNTNTNTDNNTNHDINDNHATYDYHYYDYLIFEK